MATSNYYGLQKLVQNENLPTNDYSFGTFNIDVLDRLLYKINSNIFSQTHPIDNPTSGPVLSLSTGGSVPAATIVKYKYSYVDSYGNETAASPESQITTPYPVASPGAAYAYNTASGGSLTFGTYFYVLSAYSGSSSNETLVGANSYVQIPSGTANLITLVMPTIPAGADGINVYKRGPGQSIYYFLDNIVAPSAGDHFVDDGITTQNVTRSPSNANTTNSTNTITVTLPGATPAVPYGYTWKVYRTYTSSYDSSVLHYVVEETSTGSGVITPSYDDIGLTASIGHPQTQNLIFGDLLLPSTVYSHGNGSTRGHTTLVVDQELNVVMSDTDTTHYEFHGMLKYAARTTEDLKFQIGIAYDIDDATPYDATPYIASDLILNYHVLPYELTAAGVAGQIYDNSDVVVLAGAGESTYRMVEIHGFVVHDAATPFPVANVTLAFYWAKNSDDATPGTATIANGSFFKKLHETQ